MKKLEYAIQKDEGLHMKEAVEFVDMTEDPKVFYREALV